jgi:hypothetical protein
VVKVLDPGGAKATSARPNDAYRAPLAIANTNRWGPGVAWRSLDSTSGEIALRAAPAGAAPIPRVATVRAAPALPARNVRRETGCGVIAPILPARGRSW